MRKREREEERSTLSDATWRIFLRRNYALLGIIISLSRLQASLYNRGCYQPAILVLPSPLSPSPATNVKCSLIARLGSKRRRLLVCFSGQRSSSVLLCLTVSLSLDIAPLCPLRFFFSRQLLGHHRLSKMMNALARRDLIIPSFFGREIVLRWTRERARVLLETRRSDSGIHSAKFQRDGL